MRTDLRRRSSLPCLSTVAQTISIAVLLHVGGVESQRVSSTVVLAAVLTPVLTIVLTVLPVVLPVVLTIVLTIGLGMDNTSCK